MRAMELGDIPHGNLGEMRKKKFRSRTSSGGIWGKGHECLFVFSLLSNHDQPWLPLFFLTKYIFYITNLNNNITQSFLYYLK